MVEGDGTLDMEEEASTSLTMEEEEEELIRPRATEVSPGSF